MLWGLLLGEVGAALGDTHEVTAARLLAAVRRGAEKIQRVGGAELGDKTMLDALFPFVDACDTQLRPGAALAEAWGRAAAVAVQAGEATASLLPKVGRARPLAERSVGTADAGATSMGLVLTAVGEVLIEACPEGPHQ